MSILKLSYVVIMAVALKAPGQTTPTSGAAAARASAPAAQPAISETPAQPAAALPGAEAQAAETNQFTQTNQFSGGDLRLTNLFATTNQLEFTNNIGGTNQFTLTNLNATTNLAPTGRPNRRNISATNRTTLRDEAVSQQDTSLLVTIRQRIQTDIALSRLAPNVRFVVRDGVVTVVGIVPTAQEEQGLLTFIQQTPGVGQVVDQLGVAPVAPAGQNIPEAVGGAPSEPAPADQPAPTAQSAPSASTPRIDVASPDEPPAVEGIKLSQGLVLTDSDRALFAKIRPTLQQEVTAIGTDPSIEVSIQNGVVTLSGTATSTEEKRRITSVLQQLDGVKRVENEMKIGGVVVP